MDGERKDGEEKLSSIFNKIFQPQKDLVYQIQHLIIPMLLRGTNKDSSPTEAGKMNPLYALLFFYVVSK